MADYRDLLRRAVEALPDNNGASRRDVYEKARKALVGQLDSIKPALPAREKTQHRLQLEDCIREVEQEATERLLGGLTQYDDPAPAETVAPAPVVKPVPKVESKVKSEPKPEAAAKPETASTSKSVSEKTEAKPKVFEKKTPEVKPENEAAKQEEETSKTAKPADADKFPTTEKSAPKSEAKPEPDSADKAASDQSDQSDDDDKSSATPAADVKSADKTPAKTSADNAAEPDADLVAGVDVPAARSVDEILRQAELNQSKKAVASVAPVVGNAGATGDVSGTDSDLLVSAVDKSDAISGDVSKIDVPAMSSVREVEVDSGVTPVVTEAKSGDPQSTIDSAIAALDREANGDEDTDKPAADAASAAISAEGGDVSFTPDKTDEGGGNALTIFLVVFLLLVVGVGGAGYWAWREGYVDLNTLFASDEPAVTNTQDVANTDDGPAQAADVSNGPGNTEAVPDDVASSDQPLVVVDDGSNTLETSGASDVRNVGNGSGNASSETIAQPNVDDKIEDRLPGTETAEIAPTTDVPTLGVDSGSAEIIATESQSLLLEASEAGTTGAVPFSGTIEWSRGVDELGQPTLIGEAKIPARNLGVRVLLRKNGDPSLPASHLMEIDYEVTESFIGGGISALPGVLLKDQELIQGTPLAGASARVVGNSFLFALSASEADVSRNMGLLRDRKWMDLAMIYATGKRAIITLEKDDEAQALFEEVIAQWTAE